MLKNEGLLDKLSPMDLLEEFSKVYMVKIGEKEIMSEVPKKVRGLDWLGACREGPLFFLESGCLFS